FHVATKVGRRANPHVAASYTRENLTAYVERSLQNLEVEALDLLQLHCPPSDVYYQPEVFGVLDDLKRQGKLKHYGVSVERVEEALKAIEYPEVQTVQLVYNIFRQRPSELFFSEAQRRKVGILARLPLSSGLLTGKLKKGQQFAADDHRTFNRAGAAFDRGETFSGFDYDTGLDVVEELRALVPANMSLAQLALRWIDMHDAVTCSIPGARRPEQVAENVAALDFPPLSDDVMRRVKEISEARVRPAVHQLW
ncbi:MAG TPA: aldo/keto reductase, partial [Polyangiaceae bacterium]